MTELVSPVAGGGVLRDQRKLIGRIGEPKRVAPAGVDLMHHKYSEFVFSTGSVPRYDKKTGAKLRKFPWVNIRMLSWKTPFFLSGVMPSASKAPKSRAIYSCLFEIFKQRNRRRS
jgi:hypothetical protein